MITDLEDYKCYTFQRRKWLDPLSCNSGTLKVVKMVFPHWEKYEEKYLKEIENETVRNC